MEQDDGPRIAAMKALESALGRVAAQIYEGESRTRGAITEVRQDLSDIARRVDRLEEDLRNSQARLGTAEQLEGALKGLTEKIHEIEERSEEIILGLGIYQEQSLGNAEDHLIDIRARMAGHK